MANQSILAAFERMWQHISIALNGKSDTAHNHDGAYATKTELGEVSYMVGDEKVSDQIATAIANKSDSGHTHNYAGSSSAGGAATSANKLNTNAGSTTQPVYFSNGVPVKTTYTLGASVPSDAKFTDTTYSAATTSAAGLMSAADKTKLDGIATGANKITVDSALSSSSTNPVQNKVVNTAIANLNSLVGDTAVSTQIVNAMNTLREEILGGAW